jgi:hypothetical protein
MVPPTRIDAKDGPNINPTYLLIKVFVNVVIAINVIIHAIRNTDCDILCIADNVMVPITHTSPPIHVLFRTDTVRYNLGQSIVP